MEVKARALHCRSPGGEPAAGLLHQLLAASDITTGGQSCCRGSIKEPATRSAPTAVGSRLHQLVAVVDEDQTTGLNRLHPLHQPADLSHGQRRTPASRSCAGSTPCGWPPTPPRCPPHRRCHRQRSSSSGATPIRQGPLALLDADDLFQGVVGATSWGQPIARPQHAIGAAAMAWVPLTNCRRTAAASACKPGQRPDPAPPVPGPHGRSH